MPKKDDQSTKDQPKKDQASNDSSKSNPASSTSGVIKVQDNRCGPNGATSKSFTLPPLGFTFDSEPFTEQVTQTTGPNGSLDWLNCGIESGGWNPPFVRVTDLVTVDLDDAIAQGGPFTACKSYIWAFKQFGGEFGRKFYFQFGPKMHEIDVELETFVSSSSHPLGFDRSAGKHLQPSHCRWCWRTGSHAVDSRQVRECSRRKLPRCCMYRLSYCHRVKVA